MKTASPANPPSLEQLHDLQLPAEVGFWPPAPGWWLLAALLLGGLIWAGIFLWRRWQRNRYRRAALKLLAEYQRQLQQDQDPQRYLTQVAQLLRRTALRAYPQQTLAGLTDNAWRQFLIDSSGLDGFNESTGDALLRGPYQAAIEFDTDAVQQLARNWILHHKRRWPC
ncbi:DUF4381 domain-containing protein [Marinobacterium sedimentorum]|uniref:DUF4381 domain-containing protein n=1 Tax=Marinobacterium sedimentorum TaxID=2927804 RepID=UPI0020C6D476|nr:DUF4381 domain-containing protein [Marinobacterium sedimentorum]MCP8690065.1 DUF4381 domain-containing protein [Marinobacterium sedimentorum]